MGPVSTGAFGRVFVITAVAATVFGCEGESIGDEQELAAIPGISDTCDVEAGDVPVHLDGTLGDGPDLFVLSVDRARNGESIDVTVDRTRETVLVLASAEPVRWNVTSNAKTRLIVVEGDHDAIERAAAGTGLPLAGFHGCRRSGSFGIYD